MKGFVCAKKMYNQKSVTKGQRQRIVGFLTFVTQGYPQAVRCNDHLKHTILWSPPYETLHAGVYASSDSHFVRKLFYRREVARLNKATNGVNKGPLRPSKGPQRRFDIVIRGRWAANKKRCGECPAGACTKILNSTKMSQRKNRP